MKKEAIVRLVFPAGRHAQIRYTDPSTGKRIKVTAGTADPGEAEEVRATIEAKLRLGVSVNRKSLEGGPGMAWEDFRDRYSKHLRTLRPGSVSSCESRLNVAERIINPRTLGDMVDREALLKLRARSASGAENPRGKTRSPHTVRTHFASVIAALNWAKGEGWIPGGLPDLPKLRAPKQRAAKGRAISDGEFQSMLDAVPGVVGDGFSGSWQFVLRGLWASAMRLGELLSMHWTDPRQIVPRWDRGELPILSFPSGQQKNDTEEDIPLLPWLDDLLRTVPPESRRGWVFNPMPRRGSSGKRPAPRTVGNTIAEIGEKAGIVVNDRDGKFASAHDLRRSAGVRLLDAGVDILLVSRILRHASVETTRRFYAQFAGVQRDGRELRRLLAGEV